MLVTFDQAYFHAVCEPEQYGPDLATEIIDLFLDHTPPLLAALETALTAGDQQTARYVLHRLEGGAAGLGGVALAHLCGQLHGDLTSASQVELTASLMLLQEAYAALVPALRAEQARLFGK